MVSHNTYFKVIKFESITLRFNKTNKLYSFLVAIRYIKDCCYNEKNFVYLSFFTLL